MKQIYVATTNPGKLAEIQQILRVPLEAVDLEIDEVQSMDLVYVAKKKVEGAYEKIKKPIIVDDVGIFLDAWNGFPGPFIKFMLDSLGYDGILKAFENEKNRKVRVESAIGFHDGNKPHVFVGKATGTISFEKKGSSGFGFDPIIIPDGYSQTFAEMDPAVKNKISPRSNALVQFKEFLDSQKKQKKV